jgi:mannose-6-phosphate isomerase
MKLSTPIVFEPLPMERVWGGRRLETLYGKRLPQGSRIGESWEIVDRPEAQSVVHEGPLQGYTLHDLWTHHRETIFGAGLPKTERFPLLCKMLDAQDRLSVQVHPPPEVAERFGGEPKTEMWYVLDTLLESDLYAGLKKGVTPASFRAALAEGVVADQIHKFPVKKGDTVFMPNGRVHAIGSGNVIVEVQQNSDTTYRVFDWNRLGTDGRPRELHIEESLASIDFSDLEPGVSDPQPDGTLVDCEQFHVEKWELDGPRKLDPSDRFAIFVVVGGTLDCDGQQYPTGTFLLVPPVIAHGTFAPVNGAVALLKTTIPA